MVNVVGSTDQSERWKPKTMRDHFTVSEVARAVNRTPGRIKQLERERRIPAPARVQVGTLSVRLYSPAEVRTIKRFFENLQPGPKPRR